MDADGKIASWILEYLIWQPLEGPEYNAVLRALPRLTNGDLNLQKSILLKVLRSDASKRSISEKTLEYFEMLEEIEFRRGNDAVSALMKRAYCLAAVDCTVKLLTTGGGGDDERRLKFSETVERLWRGEIGHVESVLEGGGLGSDLLWGWRDDIVAAVSDEGAFEKIVRNFEGLGAAEAIEDYLREERERMGTPFLQRVEEGMRGNDFLKNILGVDAIHEVGEEIDVAAGGGGEDVPPSPSSSPVCGS